MKKLIKKYLGAKQEEPKVIAKIEKKEGVENFDEILKIVDGVMVARGDLGVEIEDKQVPIIQKDIVSKCIASAKPVIVATQMLDSMIRNPRPTRAEVSDVANAVIDGADCVMLSGESAFGKYPINAVHEMNSIIQATEKSIYGAKTRAANAATKKSEALEQYVHELVSGSGAKAIFGAVHTFETASLLSHDQPQAPILLFASKPKLMRQLCMLANVCPIAVKSLQKINNLSAAAKPIVRKYKLAKKGQDIILLAGQPKQIDFDMIEMQRV